MVYKATVLRLYPDALGSAILIGGILRQSVDPGVNVSAENVAGSHYPLFGAVNAVNPRMMFDTYDVVKALDAVGMLGLAIESDDSGRIGAELYQIQYDDVGQIVSGSSHRLLRIRKGILIPRQLTCQHQQDAQLSLELIGITDGTNDPVIFAESQASPGAAVDPTRHTLNAAVIESVSLTKLSAVRIDFGLTVNAKGDGSNPFPTRIEIQRSAPTITVETESPELFSASGVPLKGKAATHANSLVTFRKRTKNTGSFVADGTAEHIGITTAGVLYAQTAWDASANADASATYMVQSLYDGTNAPLVIDTTYALA